MLSPSYLSNDTVAMTHTDLDDDWLSFAGALSGEMPSTSVSQGAVVFGNSAPPSHQLAESPGVTGVPNGIQAIPVRGSSSETRDPINYTFDGELYDVGFDFQ